jgi:hypothetical protein
LSALFFATLIASSSIASAAEVNGPKEPSSEPVKPSVSDRDVKSLSEEHSVKKWKPGDPVKVVPDLREETSGEIHSSEEPDDSAARTDDDQLKPKVGEPVEPSVSTRSAKELGKIEPYKEGDPVRVVPDLKED